MEGMHAKLSSIGEHGGSCGNLRSGESSAKADQREALRGLHKWRPSGFGRSDHQGAFRKDPNSLSASLDP